MDTRSRASVFLGGLAIAAFGVGLFLWVQADAAEAAALYTDPDTSTMRALAWVAFVLAPVFTGGWWVVRR